MAKRIVRREFIHRHITRKCLVAPGYVRTITFKSRTVESRWAGVLEFFVRASVIMEWDYEPKEFHCGRKYRKDRLYTPDFRVLDNGAFDYPGKDVWFETKSLGWFAQKDISRLRWFSQSFPTHIIYLVFDRRPANTRSKTSQKQRIMADKASKWVERILYMNDYDK